jgi:hypothetical protein
MEFIDTSADLKNMTKEQRIKALIRRVPAYVRETDSDCRTVLKLYSLIVENEYWRDVADSEEAYFLEYCKKPKAWFESVREYVMTMSDSKNPTVGELQQAKAMELANNPNGLNQPSQRKLKVDPAKVQRLRDKGLTQKQIADELGCTEARVSQIANLNSYYHGNMNLSNTNNSPLKQGNTSEYLAARLARDNPDILERVKAGEFPSMRAAAVAAGIVKARQSFSMTASTTPEAFGNTLLQKLDPEFALRLAEHIVQQLNK